MKFGYIFTEAFTATDFKTNSVGIKINALFALQL